MADIKISEMTAADVADLGALDTFFEASLDTDTAPITRKVGFGKLATWLATVGFLASTISATALALGGSLQSNHALDVLNSFAVTAAGINSQPTITATSSALLSYESRVKVAAGSVVLTTGYAYFADSASIGSGSSITTQHGFFAASMVGAGTNYAFYSAGSGLISFGDALTVRSGNLTVSSGNLSVTGTLAGTSTLALGDTITITKNNDANLNFLLGGGGQGTTRVQASNGTTASPTILSTSAALYNFDCFGWDGSGYRRAVQVTFSLDGAPGSGSMPGKVTFLTTPSGSTTAVERLRITSAGLLTFAGATSSFPALKRSSAELQARLADDSAYAAFHALSYSANGTAGVTAGPFTTITSIRTVGGIVTVLTGS